MKFDAVQLDAVVNQLEKAHGIKLSTGARHALTSPIVEAQGFGSDVSNAQVSKSLARIIASTSEHIDPLTGNSRHITSLAVAQAIHLNFCNIPPFCAPLVRTDAPSAKRTRPTATTRSRKR
jgi:hypothetical protein